MPRLHSLWLTHELAYIILLAYIYNSNITGIYIWLIYIRVSFKFDYWVALYWGWQEEFAVTTISRYFISHISNPSVMVLHYTITSYNYLVLLFSIFVEMDMPFLGMLGFTWVWKKR